MSQASRAQNPPRVEENGTIHVPAFLLPESSLLDDETHSALKRARDEEKVFEANTRNCPFPLNFDWTLVPKLRKCQAEVFYNTVFYKKIRDHFDVVISAQQIGGVYTEVFTPQDGVAPENKGRVLINLHGGHFGIGSRFISQLESIPIASVGKSKVISVDYRMAPEYSFPAASEDVAAVYRELLKSYRPKNIGIYGCSAGGLLTAESIAWFQKETLPLPGAVGMFGGAASYYQEGDSALFASAREGFRLEPPSIHPYFKGTNSANPLAFPIRSGEVMKNFPPSLLVASTRDVAMSSVVYTHSQLVRLGVEADLHVWEGMDHCFFSDPDLPESRDFYDVVVRFFDQHLGK
jgi:monoterpene epsilon-lactone hydrolase